MIGFNIIRLGTVIAFTYSDGSVEYRDRITMNEVWNMVNLNRISSVIEAGFTQPGEPSCKLGNPSDTLANLAHFLQACKQYCLPTSSQLFSWATMEKSNGTA